MAAGRAAARRAAARRDRPGHAADRRRGAAGPRAGRWRPVLIGAALTGAAVLRATGRIFLGLGPDPGEEEGAPTEEEQEKADRPALADAGARRLLLLLALPGLEAAAPSPRRRRMA